MKKEFLFTIAFAATIASCTQDGNVVEIDYTEPSEIAIKFGTAGNIAAGVEQVASRAEVEEWDNTNVGVFLLSKDADADWQGQQTRDMVWNNVSAFISSDNSSRVELNGQSGYYPNQGDRNFSFFGYHPYSNNNLVFTPTTVTKTFNITGQEDILWGKAEVEGNGYNAKYFRTNPDVVPNIAFGHVLTKLQFKVKASPTFAEGQNFKVTGIKVINTADNVTLTVADRTGGTAGAITGDNDAILTAYNNAIGITISQGVDATNAGDPIMLKTDQSYQIVLEMSTPNSQGTRETEPITINSGIDGFQQGYAYDVTLTINSFTEIKFTASLIDWVTGEPIEVEI